MKAYITEFMNNAVKFIEDEFDKLDEASKKAYLEEYTTKLTFFMHERLIHLIVTVLFAIMEIISITAMAVANNLISIVLSVMFMILLIPYVMHYYFLENSVQEMYKIRDRILSKMNR